jgi:hypothetical protein
VRRNVSLMENFVVPNDKDITSVLTYFKKVGFDEWKIV